VTIAFLAWLTLFASPLVIFSLLRGATGVKPEGEKEKRRRNKEKKQGDMEEEEEEKKLGDMEEEEEEEKKLGDKEEEEEEEEKKQVVVTLQVEEGAPSAPSRPYARSE